MEKKLYQTPQIEVMNISSQTMMTISDTDSNVFDGYTGGGTGTGHANKRRNSWGNTNW